MGFFDRPDDYSKMLERMAWVTGAIVFVASAFLVEALFQRGVVLPSPSVLSDLEVKAFGFTGSLWAVLPAVLVAWIFRRVRMHDRISDALKIREAFDTHVILSRLAGEVGVPVDLERIEKLREKRQDLMYKVFYPYVDSNEPKISKHHVAEALDAWFGYWIAIEAAVVLAPTGVMFLFLGETRMASVFLCCALLCTFVGMRYFARCAPLAEHEISAITSHEKWKDWQISIRKHFEDAL